MLGAQWPSQACSLTEHKFKPLKCVRVQHVRNLQHWQSLAEWSAAAHPGCDASAAMALTVGSEFNFSKSSPHSLSTRQIRHPEPVSHRANRNDVIRNRIINQLKVWYADAVEALAFPSSADGSPKVSARILGC